MIKDKKCLEIKCCECPLKHVCYKCDLPFVKRTLGEVLENIKVRNYNNLKEKLEKDD